MAGYGYIYMHPPAQDTNTNDEANGITFCVFYDTQTNGMCVSMCWTLCLCYVCAHDMSMCCSMCPSVSSAVFCAFIHCYTPVCFLADWSTEGCQLMMQDAETVTCACNHLTAFSVLQVKRF